MSVGFRLAELTGGLSCRGCGRAGTLLCMLCAHSLPRPMREGSVPFVDVVVARWAYENAIRTLILELKLSASRTCAEPLASGLVAEARRRGLAGSVITWVPARRSDIRQRGFDHAELLARASARSLGLPCRRFLAKRASTPDQTSLSAEQRRVSLVGSFAARRSSERVILVDDLVTTGATASECARVLRAAGAIGVELLAAARA